MRFMLLSVMFAFSLLMLNGCSRPAAQDTEPAPDGSKYLLTSEPAEARGVIESRNKVKDKENVVIVGRIGGDKKPWTEGRAAFKIVDLSLKPCSEEEGCPTPWDYCCAKNLGQATIFVKVVDDKGNLVNHGAKDLLNVKELDTVVIQGTALRDKNGNLTVLAKGVYIKK